MDPRFASQQPIVILGAGINGCALARELVLNDQHVWLVDAGDIASGTTAYSTRLIHGGLRYLEYAEFDLVRESLGERTRLLRLAPHLVRPIELFVPVRNQFGGMLTAARRFLHLEGKTSTPRPRGAWLVRAGLRLYDAYAQDRELPRHRTVKSGRAGEIPVDPARYPWQCAYYDAQVRFPERFTLALVEDARRAAASGHGSFSLFTYHRATLEGPELVLRPGEGDGHTVAARTRPALLVNATGAWVDETLAELGVPSPRLLNGTKGSHFFTDHASLREVLAGRGLYAEADDGRPVFILPFGDGTLVGTTDERYHGPPENAVARDDELAYLLDVVNTLLPSMGLAMRDINWHYSGVRPLPATGDKATAAITRRHFLTENKAAPLPFYSLVGGKLTTCRSLAEDATRMLLARLGCEVKKNSRERPLPGGEHFPRDAAAIRALCATWSAELGLPQDTIAAVTELMGSHAREVLRQLAPRPDEVLPGTKLPRALVRWAVEHEWASRLADLVERRLMLVFAPRLERATLESIAAEMVQIGTLSREEAECQLDAVCRRLEKHFGRRIVPSAASGGET